MWCIQMKKKDMYINSDHGILKLDIIDCIVPTARKMVFIAYKSLQNEPDDIRFNDDKVHLYGAILKQKIHSSI